jgi:hypothetical protein
MHVQDPMMPRVAAMLCISTLTLLLLATSCMCDNNARRLLSVKPTPTVELGQAQYFTVLGASMVTTAVSESPTLLAHICREEVTAVSP